MCLWWVPGGALPHGCCGQPARHRVSGAARCVLSAAPVHSQQRVFGYCSKLNLIAMHAGVGHCPHDDNPPLVNEQLLQWLQKYHI
jgi:hypothetical protein